MQHCAKENNLDLVKLNSMQPDDFSNCKAFQCFMTKTQLMDQNGNLNDEALLSKVPQNRKEKVAEHLKECKQKKGNNSCETAQIISMCLVDRINVRPQKS